MKVSVLTCTGGRPEAFALCEKWMGRQTYPIHEWIVVDDCEPTTKTTMGQVRVEPRPAWSGKVTLGRNLIAGLGKVTGDAVAFIEDDDWYAPAYLATLAGLLDIAPLAGEGLTKYYNVRTRNHAACCNAAHACLAGTICRSWYIPKIVEVIEELGPTVCCDLTIWRSFDHSILSLGADNVIGMKGLPGRPGIACGHTDQFCDTPDPEMVTLREWIGDDVRHYDHFSC